MARAFAELRGQPERAPNSAHAEWLGLLLDREATERYDRRLARGCAMPGCASRPPSRMSTIAPRAVSIAPCSRALIAGDWIEEAQNLIIEGPTGVGKSLACLRARPQGLPRQPLGRSISASPRCSPISRWPAATAATPG